MTAGAHQAIQHSNVIGLDTTGWLSGCGVCVTFYKEKVRVADRTARAVNMHGNTTSACLWCVQAVAEEAAARKARERILLEYVQGTPPHGRPAPT